MISSDILILLLIALLSLDNTHVFQGNLSKPIVGCAIIGLLVGNLHLGLLVGISFQVLWLAILPVGGNFFPEGGISAMFSLFILNKLITIGYVLDQVFFAAVLFAVFFAIAAGGVSLLNRKLNAQHINWHEKNNHFMSPWVYILWGVLTHFIVWFLILSLLAKPVIKLIGLMSQYEIFHLPVNWVVSSFVAIGIVLFVQTKLIKRYKIEIAVSAIIGGTLLCFL